MLFSGCVVLQAPDQKSLPTALQQLCCCAGADSHTLLEGFAGAWPVFHSDVDTYTDCGWQSSACTVTYMAATCWLCESEPWAFKVWLLRSFASHALRSHNPGPKPYLGDASITTYPITQVHFCIEKVDICCQKQAGSRSAVASKCKWAKYKLPYVVSEPDVGLHWPLRLSSC